MGRHATVASVMTQDVVTACRDTCFKDLVRIMARHRVGALPVVDDLGILLGVVSKGDLIVREERPDAQFSTPVFELHHHRVERRKALGDTAEGVMSAMPITVGPDATVGEAARLMRASRVKRLLVVDPAGHLLGVVTRGDVLQVFLRPDTEIRSEILEEVIARELCMDSGRLRVQVRDGVVLLEGDVPQRSVLPLLLRAVRGVDGVVRVENRLGWDEDDPVVHVPTISGPKR